MEFSRANLSKAVYYALTLHPNKRFTAADLYDEIESENICPELTNVILTRATRINALKDITNAMHKTSEDYNNVYCIDGTCYLKQKNKYIADWEPSIRTETSKSLINLDSIECEGDSLLHLLCRNGEDELIESIARYHNLDLTRKNSKGESVADVVFDDVKTLKTLLKIVSRQALDFQSSKLEEAVLRNEDLMAANRGLVVNKKKLDLSNDNLRIWNFRLIMVCLMMFAVMTSIVMLGA